MSFSMLYCALRISSNFSFISLTTWKWSKTCTALGQFSSTEEMKAAERSVAIYLMSSFFLLPLFPESDQSIDRLALTHMENPTALEVNDNGLVRMPFSDSKLVYADAVHSLKRGRSIATLKIMSVNLFDRVPRHAQKMGCVFEGASLSRGRPPTL